MRRFLLVLLVSIVALTACDRKGRAIEVDYPLTKITERVYVIYGPTEFPNKKNQGFMNNPGFVVTKSGVVVVDPGSSVQTGEMVLRKIASVTSNPVVAIFNTHSHGDHWLGNDAIRRAYPKAVIYAHPKMIEKGSALGEQWVARMNRLTDNATRGTKVVMPDLGIEHEDVLTLNGLHFRAYHPVLAHSDSDLMIEVVEEKVLFTGDVVMAGRVGVYDEGSFKGNIAGCDMALKSPAVQFVPGHGQAGDRRVVENYRGLMSGLLDSVRKYQKAGLSDFEMKDKVFGELGKYRDWSGLEAEIGRMVSLAYLQLEQETF